MKSPHKFGRILVSFILITLLGGVLSFTFTDSAVAASGPVSASLSANPSNVNKGDKTTLSWNSTNTEFCVAHSNVQSGWFGIRSISGNESVAPTQTAIYFITCSNSSGYSRTTQTTVTVGEAATSTVGVNLTANPESIFRGESTTLIWSSTNATSCEASGYWAGLKPPFGSESVSPSETVYYTLRCNNNLGESASDTQSIFVNPNRVSRSVAGSFNAACVPSQSTISIGQPVIFAGAQSYGTEPVRYSWSGDVSGTSQTISVSFSAAGSKTARLSAADSSGRTANAACSVQVVTGGAVPKPAGPTIRAVKLPIPADLKPNNESFLSNTDEITLSWDAVKGAKFYAVRAEVTGGTDERDFRNNCPKNPHYVCINGLTENKLSIEVEPGQRYSWWVHAIDSSGNLSEPASAWFSVKSDEAGRGGNFFANIFGSVKGGVFSLGLIILAFILGYTFGKRRSKFQTPPLKI